ncbi:MAG TPA: FG-GAP-like repeat-containing protein [Acidobacteriota bacterium]|nr:FG-GAP-like repeat-containing protein [Acidobacteriota bacterium]
MGLRSIIFCWGCVSLAAGAFGGSPPIEGMPFWSTAELGLYSTGMMWRDCNNDGVIDVFFSNGNDMSMAHNTIHVSQLGVLPAQATWTSINHAYSGHCAVGDIDDNGFPDFIVANYLGLGFTRPNVSDLYLNNGSLPEMYPSWFTPDSLFTFSCALGDLDNDGDLDIAFSTGEGYYGDRQRDLVYLNDDGAFAAPAVWESADSTMAYDVAWGDVDNDGDLDLALCYTWSPAAVYYNDAGVLETTPSWQASTAESGNTLTFGDVNGDGWLDLVVAYNNQQNGDGYFRAYFNDGAGQLDPDYGWQSFNGGAGSALALYDYDNDGDDDLAAGRWFRQLFIYENLGVTFTTAPVWTSDIEIVAEELAWADIDGTGVELFADTMPAESGRRLFYVRHHPLYAVDSVVVDGVTAENADYCYDLVSGWVSLASEPLSDVIVQYRYSFTNDLTVANWDTVNMAFANTTRPAVEMFAEPRSGWAPLTVQFSDSSAGASGWLWDFGDGETSPERNPSHEYLEGGLYDVTLDAVLPDGHHRRQQRGMIVALGDTIFFGGQATNPPTSVMIPVVLKNTHPVHELILPVSFLGDPTLGYTGFSTAGCRTEYFQDVSLIESNPSEQKLVFRLRPGEAEAGPLEPGKGPILYLFFYQIIGGTNTIDTTTLKGYSLELDALYTTYQPRVVAGHIYSGACGNLDGSPDGIVDIGDLTALIDYLFVTHTPPAAMEQANVDGSADGVVDISDLTYLIRYLFIEGPPPVCP